MSKPKRITVAEYLTQQINICAKSQKEIAEEVGYDKPNVITMFKQGKTKLPINKVPLFAKSLGVDPAHMLRIAMSEYTPEVWTVIEQLVGNSIVSNEEMVILDVVRTVGDGQHCFPTTEEDIAELTALAVKWRNKSDALAEAARARIEREKAARKS